MRQTLLRDTDAVAMLAIGGMQGVRDEAELFLRLRPPWPVFVTASTGGAAAWLASRADDAVQALDRRVPDQIRMAESRIEREPVEREGERADEIPYRYTPYPGVPPG